MAADGRPGSGRPADLATERTLRAISAALDGEGELPADLDEDAAGFHDTAVRLRQAVRLQQAAVPPDVTAAVMAQVRRGAGGQLRSRRPGLAVAAAFLAAAVVAAVTVAPGWRAGEGTAAADVAGRLLTAQRTVLAADATLTLVERGAHPDLPLRRYEGHLRYRAPEQLWLSLRDVSARPDGWPANDIDLVIADGVLHTSGLRDCPVAAQPGCLAGPRSRSVVGMAPFAADVQAPLDLVVPVSGVPLTDASLVAATGAPTGPGGHGDPLVLQVTVAHVRALVDALTGTGAIRQVHPSDPVTLRLDADDLELRGMSVRAADGDARATWAAANGYTDRPGDPLLELQLTPTAPIDAPSPPATAPDADAGFVEGPSDPGLRLTSVPEGFVLHRAGHLVDGGPLTHVLAHSDGRAWLRVDATPDWQQEELFGDLGPLVRQVPVGEGIGWTTVDGDVVAVHGRGWDVAVRGSVPLEVLVATAASVVTAEGPVVGQPLPSHWRQADLLTDLPAGALRPPGPLTAGLEDDGSILVAVSGVGSSGALLRQQPGELLPPPVKADVTEVVVRGVPGRWSAPLGLLTWADDGWLHELSSAGLDLEGMVAIAEDLS